MALIGLLLNLAAITASAWANHHEHDDAALTLRPSEHTVVRYTNESLIVQCRSPTPEVRLHWRSPKGDIIKEHKDRIHIEQSAPDQLKIVFAHISLADKGNWSCEDVGGEKPSKSFNLIVYEKITFTENATIITVKEGSNATILCEVKGEPQPNVTWNFNGQPITIDTNSTKFRILADGLLINRVTQNDTGEYTCRAYQVNSIASDMQERTVLMKIEHKPFWTHKHHVSEYFAYYNGTATIVCEAIAEPPANFTWYRGKANKKHLQNDKYYTIESDNYISELTIQARNMTVFDTYKCRARNNLGSIEHSFTLEMGIKPPTPDVFKLRGLNSNTFDVEVQSVRKNGMSNMEVNGYRIEYMTEYEFKADAGKWSNAKRKDFRFEDGATFLLNNLESNTTYLVRAASKNLAGLSDWTRVERFRTQSTEPPSAGAHLEHLTALPLLYISLIVWLLSKELSFGFQSAARLTKPDHYKRTVL